MKVVYNSKEIADNQNNYNRLTEKPLINSVELVGNITLNDINVYSKEEVKKLISSARSVKVAAVQPSPLTPNTTYYIGPDTNGIYKVYLTDASDPINYFQIGTTSFGKYFSGEGINVTDPQNVVSVLVDSESVVINSEGLMEARPVFEKMLPFTGATASADGKGGLVPAPAQYFDTFWLTSLGTWERQNLYDLIYPVGSIFLTNSSSVNPGSIFINTTWTKMAGNLAFQTDGTGGSTIDAGMPNIKGNWTAARGGTSGAGFGSAQFSGAFQKYSNPNLQYCIYSSDGHTSTSNISFAASNSSSVYQTGVSTVRPNSVTVVAWRRTA